MTRRNARQGRDILKKKKPLAIEVANGFRTLVVLPWPARADVSPRLPVLLAYAIICISPPVAPADGLTYVDVRLIANVSFVSYARSYRVFDSALIEPPKRTARIAPKPLVTLNSCKPPQVWFIPTALVSVAVKVVIAIATSSTAAALHKIMLLMVASLSLCQSRPALKSLSTQFVKFSDQQF